MWMRYVFKKTRQYQNKRVALETPWFSYWTHELHFHQLSKLLYDKDVHALLFIPSLGIRITCRFKGAWWRRETKAFCQIDVSAIIRYGNSDLRSSQRRDLRREGIAGPQHRSLYKITRRGPQVSIACIILWHQKLPFASVRDRYPVRWSSIKPN